MDRTRIQSAAQDVATAFLPGALFLMLGTLVAVPALRGGDLGRMLSSVSWRMMGLELALLAAGFGAARMLARLDGARGGRWRIALAGAASVLLLGAISVFSQGAGWMTIALASVVAGAASTLVLPPPARRG